jgi:hypothetical protein
VVQAVDDWLRMQEHPQLRFVTTNTGERRAKLIDGPEVWTVAEAWQDHALGDRRVSVVADATGLTAFQVQAALDYWADHREEIDSLVERQLAAQQAAFEAAERRRALVGAA